MTMECSNENQVVSVEEPSKCLYSMRFLTPAVCNSHHAAILRMNLEAEQRGSGDDVEAEGIW